MSVEGIGTNEPKLINLKSGLKHPLLRALYSLIERPFESILAVRALNSICSQTMAMTEGANFFEKGLRVMNVKYTISEEDKARIPQTGPLVVVSNHPMGGIEGVIIGALLTSIRPDVKLLVNYLLNNIAHMRPWNIAVDPFGGTGASRTNVGPLKECIKWLRKGGCLATFPAGTVSHLHLRNLRITDPEWSENVAALVRHTGATVVPIFFEGRNSISFQLAGLLHPLLRTALLPRELCARVGTTIKVQVGKAIPASRLEEFESDREITQFLRFKTYLLGNRDAKNVAKSINFTFPKPAVKTPPPQVAIIPAVDPTLLAAEITALPAENLLVNQGDYQVFIAQYVDIPHLVREIGRLRELTFREVGEGTGKAFDVDEFDEHYLHLFMWNTAKREIVGAYRLGCTDTILSIYGKHGLYTSTLFHYRSALLVKLNPAIELGRSFIRSQYQRKHISLSLIWRGIGEFIARNPRYRLLFGPVSISNEYNPISKNLIVQFLRRTSMNQRLSRLVKARTPPRRGHLGSVNRSDLKNYVRDIEDVSAAISEIETDQKGIPVLLRQYLKLNATLLSFNLDADFSDCIDGLVLVDLTTTDPKILRRFLGEKGTDDFVKYHQKKQEALEV
ncbi:MAG: lysophospholipid acyltransferase family protein [Verrucomicrobiota bacterium]|nr:lysophospholipid acyltransferase family protein [Verrucomicrobiota bacterium]